MSEFIFKDGNRCKITEYEVRTIDEFGDSDEIHHYESKDEALSKGEELFKDGAIAVVVEKHIKRFPAHLFNKPDEFTILATWGDKEALGAGGWTREVCG